MIQTPSSGDCCSPQQGPDLRWPWNVRLRHIRCFAGSMSAICHGKNGTYPPEGIEISIKGFEVCCSFCAIVRGVRASGLTFRNRRSKGIFESPRKQKQAQQVQCDSIANLDVASLSWYQNAKLTRPKFYCL
jgi:hypothetical protein